MTTINEVTALMIQDVLEDAPVMNEKEEIIYVQNWCKENNAHYYARTSEQLSITEGKEEARSNHKAYVVLHKIS